MSVVWTEDQRRVIDTRNSNILVSAAAGSGKTAVLVERILALITDPAHPVDVDRLLITTFTNAAAGEMRERIGKRIGELLKDDPSNAWLQRQETLVHRAQITTIHGFCLYVIRNYFHTIDLNPNFRIADEGEMRLMKQDIAQELVNAAHRAGDEAFLHFADCYGSGNRGGGLEDMILQLYEYAVANPQPQRWLDHCADAYAMPEDGGWENFAGAENVLRELHTAASDAESSIREARELTFLPGGPVAYQEALADDERLLRDLQGSGTVEEFRDLLVGASYAKLPSRRSKAMAGVDEELCERVMALRSDMKESLKALKKQYFSVPDEIQFEQLRRTEVQVRTLAELTKKFMVRLDEQKRKKNILDFSDQEHFALRILTREVDGKLVPSQTADVFADYFEEIMVDEYQDSNLVQEAILESICRSRRGRDNRFMVGDVKQSIYRFRQAEPRLFLEKYESYSPNAEDVEKASSVSDREDVQTGMKMRDIGVRIDLRQNFRSRSEVLDPVNEVFRQIMRPELGGIDYDESAELRAGARYPESAAAQAELCVLAREDWEAWEKECRWTKPEAEAHMAAARIRELLTDAQVTENGEVRAVHPGDIVILLRTMSGWSETFVRVLQDEGIPARAQSREGYLGTMEVETLLSYLKVLDNPTQEIPLAAALHGMLGGFSSEELAKIRTASQEGGFYQACVAYAGDEQLRARLRDFLARMEKNRERAAYMPVHELLWSILTENDYLNRVRALPGGEQRFANVQMLLAKAQDYEKISYHGLFHFVRYIEHMQKYQMDFGEAALSGEGGDAVQIMSIHHSKGLEFPVVFVAGMGKSFNRQESRDKLVLHSNWGAGLDYVDAERRLRRPTLLKQLIRRQNRQDSLGEELRILYVAMTRAKEKLILTGMAEKKLLEAERRGERLSFSRIAGAGCCLDWVLPALDPSDSALGVRCISMEALIRGAVTGQVAEALSREELEAQLRRSNADSELFRRVDERLSWEYPWKNRTAAKQKYSVTELKKLRMREESDAGEELYPEADVIPLIPQFVERTEEKTGAARGTVYHTVMEWLDFGRVSDIKAELRRLVEAGKLPEEDARVVRWSEFRGLESSGLATRMQRAQKRGELFREQPFVIGLPGDQVDGSDPEETVLIQGIIDAFFYEKNEIVLVDYKTDHVRERRELSEKYHAQLEYYAQALHMLTGKKVKERLIYSFTLGEVISV
ncbi:MAG: helicase-exonuclease AddAB subunit AddA [Lachnospiraceae bacterium]|nr:helicase-exonuclease AddAB subunit AddA [Lachnospiraceae bacterium]